MGILKDLTGAILTKANFSVAEGSIRLGILKVFTVWGCLWPRWVAEGSIRLGILKVQSRQNSCGSQTLVAEGSIRLGILKEPRA